LSNYSSGSFTPVLEGTSTAGTQTYSTQAGSWRRIGDMIRIDGRLVVTALGTAGNAAAGNWQINGLPTTVLNSSTVTPSLQFSVQSGFTLTASNLLGAYFIANTTTFLLQSYSNTGGANITVASGALTNSFNVRFGGLHREGGTTPEEKGAVECLWDIFGGTINAKGYKELDQHVGLIYGDSITLQRAQEILEKLEQKGFAASNVVFGIGSYTYAYVTRDTYGFAVKSTYGEINGVPQEIFKDPVTDSGVKKSAVGLIRVNEDLSYSDRQTPEQEETGMLVTVYQDGKLLVDQTLEEIRTRLKA